MKTAASRCPHFSSEITVVHSIHSCSADLCATGLAQLIHSTKATVTKIVYVVLNIALIASCSILDCIESPVAMSYHKLIYKGYL